MLNASMDDPHPTVHATLLPMYNPELGCVAGYMRKMPSKLTRGYWARMNKWPQRWFWVSLDLHGQQNYQLCCVKQGAHTSHKVQRVYHLVNGKLERISDTSFVLHIPNGEDLCLQCDSMMETNRWWSTLSQLIHAANIRAESLSSAYIANLPSFDSIQTGRSHSWANDSGASSFEDSMDASSDKRKFGIFVKGTSQNDAEIPEDISEEDSDYVDYDSTMKSSMEEPGEELQRNFENSSSHDLSLSSTDVPLVPNTHDRDFFNQLQHVLPRDDSTQKKDQDEFTSNTNIVGAKNKEISSELQNVVVDIAETVAPVLHKVDTMMQAVSSMLNNAVQETLVEVANEYFPPPGDISPMTSYKDIKAETFCEEDASPSPHLLSNSEIIDSKPLTDEEKQQQQLPIVSPSIIYGGHFASDDNVDGTETQPETENTDIPFTLTDASSSTSSTTTSTCFEGLTTNTPALQEFGNGNINTNIDKSITQTDSTKGTNEQVFEAICMWVGEDEQDVACVGNSLVFEGAIRHMKQPNVSFVEINISPMDTSTVSNVHLIPSLGSDKEMKQLLESDIVTADIALSEIPAPPPATPFETEKNLSDNSSNLVNDSSCEDLAGSECSTESGSPSIKHFPKDNVSEAGHNTNFTQLREQAKCDQNDTSHQNASDDNDFFSITYDTANEIDDILTKYCALFLWMGSFLRYLKPITPILKTVWRIGSFPVVGLVTFMRKITWLMDALIFQSWSMIQNQWTYAWEQWNIGGEAHATTNKDFPEDFHNIDVDKKTFGELADLARDISVKEADLSLQSSCL